MVTKLIVISTYFYTFMINYFDMHTLSLSRILTSLADIFFMLSSLFVLTTAYIFQQMLFDPGTLYELVEKGGLVAVLLIVVYYLHRERKSMEQRLIELHEKQMQEKNKEIESLRADNEATVQRLKEQLDKRNDQLEKLLTKFMT